jgi:hypothetical protein
LLATALLSLLLLLAAGGVFSWRYFDLGRPDHWTPGDTPYRVNCGAGCKSLGKIGSPHGPDGAEPVATLAVDPKVNDRIAQWGDCLQSVSDCAYGRAGAPEAVLPVCVRQAKCPAACKEAFASRTAGLKGRPVVDAYLDMFSGKDGYCTPRGS